MQGHARRTMIGFLIALAAVMLGDVAPSVADATQPAKRRQTRSALSVSPNVPGESQADGEQPKQSATTSGDGEKTVTGSTSPPAGAPLTRGLRPRN